MINITADYNIITSSNYTNIINDYDNITFSNYTDILNDYNISSLSNCTHSEFNIDIIIPSLLLTIPCGLSFLYLLSLMVYIY